ncbi:MAG: hypothetical protein LC114_18765 [Bryobacterales bacterium]|nr:hypothetical protein [Bryobacterales bacterium]
MDRLNPNRLLTAMFLYGLLAVAASQTLSGNIRIVVLLFLAGLALKTWLVREREKLEALDEVEVPPIVEEP